MDTLWLLYLYSMLLQFSYAFCQQPTKVNLTLYRLQKKDKYSHPLLVSSQNKGISLALPQS